MSRCSIPGRYGYKGTYLGKKQVLTFGGAYQYEPDVAYGDTVTGTGDSDYRGWTVDGFFEYPLAGAGTFTASAAYEDVDVDDAYLGASPAPASIGLNGQKNGWYAKAGYLLPGVPLQFFGRYEKWRFASLNNVLGNSRGGGAAQSPTGGEREGEVRINWRRVEVTVNRFGEMFQAGIACAFIAEHQRALANVVETG